MDPFEVIAAHRPYGLDCKCGRPINSDDDWTRHLVEVLGLTGEFRQLDDGQGGVSSNYRTGETTVHSRPCTQQVRWVTKWENAPWPTLAEIADRIRINPT